MRDREFREECQEFITTLPLRASSACAIDLPDASLFALVTMFNKTFNKSSFCYRWKSGVAVCVLVFAAPAANALDFEPLCYTGDGSVTPVNSCTTLKDAYRTAGSGSIIVLEDGNYTCALTLSRSGSKGDPIILRAANPLRARISDSTITITGDYNVVEGLLFNRSGIEITGHRNRVNQNRFQNGAGSLRAAVIIKNGSFNRADHNEVVDFGVGQRALRVFPDKRDKSSAQNNVFDRNHIHRSLGESRNGADGIQLGSNSQHTDNRLFTIVEYNLISRWEIDGEMISIKSSRNTIRFNTLRDSRGIAPMRHGEYNTIISNTFVDVVALVNQGNGNQIVGNRLINTPLIVKNGDIRQDEVIGGSGRHPASSNTLVAANTVVGTYSRSYIGVGMRVPGGNAARGIPATNTVLAGNTGRIDDHDGEHSGTVVKASYNGTVKPAIELRPEDVGPGSPDPACSDPSYVPGDPVPSKDSPSTPTNLRLTLR